MLFFLDTADIQEIEIGFRWGMVDGITTNPSLIAKGGKSYLRTVKEIADLVPGPVSGEVLATNYDEMMDQAKKLASLSDNVVVKLPLTQSGLQAVRKLSSCEIKTNVTLCFSAAQAILAAKSGATYISPFVGRIDDVGQDGLLLVKDIIEIYKNYGYNTRVLVASIRHPRHVVESACMGADVVTIPFKILEKLYKHPLTDLGLEQFISDWEKTGRCFNE